jgi:hypothetical protein
MQAVNDPGDHLALAAGAHQRRVAIVDQTQRGIQPPQCQRLAVAFADVTNGAGDDRSGGFDDVAQADLGGKDAAIATLSGEMREAPAAVARLRVKVGAVLTMRRTL